MCILNHESFFFVDQVSTIISLEIVITTAGFKARIFLLVDLQTLPPFVIFRKVGKKIKFIF